MEDQQKQGDPSYLKQVAATRDYFQKQVNAVDSILKKNPHEISEDDIHKLRVAIKRIKSLAELVNFCMPEFRRKKFLKWFDKVFVSAGKVRELQLEISMLQKLQLFDSLTGYSRHLKKLLKKKKRCFFLLADAALIRKLEKRAKMILPFFDAVFTNEVNGFLEEKSGAIRRLMETENLKKSEAHKLRKILKEFYYTILIFRVKDDLFQRIDEFQELLGEWHNNLVLNGYLRKAVNSGHLDHKEKKMIAGAKDKINLQSKVLFERVKGNIHTFDTSLLKFTFPGNE